MSVSKNKIREIGHLACLGDICAKLTPFMPVLALIMCVDHLIGSLYILLQLEKNLIGSKSRVYGTI